MVLGVSSHMKVKIESEKDCVQTVSVEVPASSVKEAVEKAFLSVQNQAKLPGFRPGKTPLDLIKKNFKDTAYARAQDSLLRDSVSEALRLKNIQAVQAPVIETLKFDPEKAFSFAFKVEVAPSLKVSNYKGIKITHKKREISDGDVDKALKHVAETNAKLVEIEEKTAQKNHFAVIDYEGFLEGTPIEGAKAENFLIDLSAPQTITGLAEGIIGKEVGQEFEVPVTFPEDSPAKHLAGKSAAFKVKVKALKEKKMPVLNDDFAKDLGLQTFEQLQKHVRESLERDAAKATRNDLEKQLMDKLLEDNKFSVPRSLIEKQTENLVHRQKSRLSQQGVQNEDQNQILEGMKADITRQSEREVRLAYVLNHIADEEKLNVTDEEISVRIEEILARAHPQEREKMAKALRGPYRDQIRHEVQDAKIFDWLIEKAKIKEVAGG